MELSLRFVFMVLFTPAACVVALKRPFWGLLLLVAMYYFRPEIWNAPTWFRPQLWLTVAVGAGWLINLREFRWSSLMTLAATVVAGFFAAAPFAAGDSFVAFDGAVVVAKLVVVMLFVVNLVDTPTKLNQFFWANILGFVYNLKAVFWTALTGGELDNAARADVGVGQGGGANYIAMICAMCFALCYVRWLNAVRRERMIAGMLMGLYLVALILTGSRAGFLSIGLVGAYFVFRSNKRVVGFVSLALMALLFFAIVPERHLDRFKQGFSTGSGGGGADLFSQGSRQDFSAKSRQILWLQAAVPMFFEHPIAGVGIDNFQLLSPRYAGFYAGRSPAPYVPGQRGRGFVAHSTWFQTIAEGGVLIAVPFFGMFVAAFWGLAGVRRSKSKDPRIAMLKTQALALEGVFAAIIVSSTFGSHMKIDFLWWYMGAVSALILIASRIEASERAALALVRRRSIESDRVAAAAIAAPAAAPG